MNFLYVGYRVCLRGRCTPRRFTHHFSPLLFRSSCRAYYCTSPKDPKPTDTPHSSQNSSSNNSYLHHESIVVEKSLSDKTYKKVYFLDDYAKSLADTPKSNVGQSKFLLFLRDCFLPEGYPQSVARDYTKYQTWQFVQNVVGSTAYVLATHACLTSVGVGTQTATAAAATISWILRDGLGTIGLVLYAGKFARNLDADIKRSKFLGDIMHNIGVGIEILTPLFPGKFLLLASFANLLKSIAGLTLGATKASFNKMFSLQENMADVTAKLQSQGLVAYLAGMGIGIGLTQTIPNVYGHFMAFLLLASTHLWASIQGLNTVTLNVLNEQRLNIVLEEYFRSNSIITPARARQFERLFLLKVHTEQPAITLGVSINDAFPDMTQLALALHAYRNEDYVVTHHKNQFRVVLREGVTQLGLMRAYFHAYYLKALLFTIPLSSFNKFFSSDDDAEWTERVRAFRKNFQSSTTDDLIRQTLPTDWDKKSLQFTNQNFDNFLSRIECAGWTTNNIPLPDKDMRSLWKRAA